MPKKKSTSASKKKKDERAPHRVPLPGFITEEEVGLGDVIKRVTQTFGIKPCGNCEQRAAKLNRWLVFNGRAK